MQHNIVYRFNQPAAVPPRVERLDSNGFYYPTPTHLEFSQKPSQFNLIDDEFPALPVLPPKPIALVQAAIAAIDARKAIKTKKIDFNDDNDDGDELPPIPAHW
tara:strand:+ start:1307 stop:1615 length:309 start_codon:yes stop_codon:yes gene_type:complete